MAQGPGLSHPGVAAFDVDGTLVPGDSLAPFLWELLGPKGVVRAAAAAPPAFGAYRHAGRSGAKAALLVRLLRHHDAARTRDVGVRFGRRMAERVRPEMRERIAWHRAQGHLVVLVSASLTAYLDALGAELGVDGVIATALEEGVDGRLTGRLVGANVRGPEKVARLSAWLAEHGATGSPLWAYGDSAGDTELLAMADHPTWVRKAPRR